MILTISNITNPLVKLLKSFRQKISYINGKHKKPNISGKFKKGKSKRCWVYFVFYFDFLTFSILMTVLYENKKTIRIIRIEMLNLS